MIQTPQQFDTALDIAMRLLDAPPREGSPAHEQLMGLLKDIADYRPRATPAEDESEIACAERARLARRLDAFEARVTPHYGPHWAAMVGGETAGHDPSADR